VQAVHDAGFDARVAHVPTPDGQQDGVVLTTDPTGGTTADVGSTVRLQVSQGPGDIVVPTLLGLSRDEAVATVTGAGLRARVIEQPSTTTPPNTVTSQEPQGGLKVPAGATVAITVAVAGATTESTTVTAPPSTVEVPNVVGQTADAASPVLLAAGLQPGEVTEKPAGSGRTPGLITAQNPAAGTQVAPRTKVDVTVAS
jgi:serine/threonine-protein kinase